jgi:arginine decarboxylase
LDVLVVSGVGCGETTLSAFDAALAQAGIQNFNIIKVSSILPLGWGVREADRYCADHSQYGQRLYVVMAEIRSDRIGTTIGAGVGWYQAEDGRGVFAEHVAEIEGREPTEVEHNILSKIRTTIRDLCETRNWPFCEQGLRSRCLALPLEARPTSVLVAAVYSAEPF